jgi:soluble lytic murein transglycosylase-like protein
MGLNLKVAAVALLAVVILIPVACRSAELRGASDDIDEHALFRVVGAMYDLDPELLEAVAEVESSGAANAVSSKGAIGLMQLMPATAARYRVRDPRDPVENALGAARYLSHLRDAMLRGGGQDDQLWRILAAYNAGEGAVCRYRGLPPYLETQEYVGRVLWVYLLGVSPPTALVREHLRTASPSKYATHGHQGDRDTLEQLDSLRRARAVEIDSNTGPND